MLVSVIIPTHNRGPLVCRAIESALAQTYQPIEVIVIDDGSTDDTRALVSRYGDRVLYLYQPNQGVSAARNAGIVKSKGEWIALLDSDDLWHPQKLELQVGVIRRHGDIGFLGCPFHSTNQLPDRLPAPTVVPIGVPEILATGAICTSSLVIRRTCFDRVGLFDTGLEMVEDRDMWLRLAAEFPAVLVDSPCWSYGMHSEQLSANDSLIIQRHGEVFEKFFAEHRSFESMRAFARGHRHFQSALRLAEHGARINASWHLLMSFLAFPRPVRETRWMRTKLLLRLIIGHSLYRSCRMAASRFYLKILDR